MHICPLPAVPALFSPSFNYRHDSCQHFLNRIYNQIAPPLSASTSPVEFDDFISALDFPFAFHPAPVDENEPAVREPWARVPLHPHERSSAEAYIYASENDPAYQGRGFKETNRPVGDFELGADIAETRETRAQQRKVQNKILEQSRDQLEKDMQAYAAKTAPTAAAVAARIAKRARKEHDREGYISRARPHSNIAPCLLPSTKLSSSDRLREYTRHRFCSHTRRFNVLTPVIKGNNIEYYDVSCDHAREELTENPTPLSCAFCNSLCVSVKRNCNCSVRSCHRCKFTFYRYSYANNDDFSTDIFCLCGADHKPLPMPAIKTFKPKPTSYANAHTNQRRHFLNSLSNSSSAAAVAEERSGDGFITPIEYDDSLPIPPFTATPSTEDVRRLLAAPSSEHHTFLQPFFTFLDSIVAPIKDFFTTVVMTRVDKMTDKLVSLFVKRFKWAVNLLAFIGRLKDAYAAQPEVVALTLLDILSSLFSPSEMLSPPRLALSLAALARLLSANTHNSISRLIADSLPKGKLSEFFSEHTCIINIMLPILPTILASLLPGKTIPREKSLDLTFLYSLFGKVQGIKPLLMIFNTCAASCRNLFSLLRFLVNLLPDFIATYFLPFDDKLYIQRQIARLDSPFHRAFTRCTAFAALPPEMSTCITLSAERDAARASIRELRTFCVDNRLYSPNITSFVNQMEKLISMPITPKHRVYEPFCLWITGGAGSGKSETWPELLSPLYPDLTTAQIRAKAYTRDSSQEYWSGCPSDVEIVLYDDFNQSRDETDLMELVRLVSIAEFTPNQASLDNSNIGIKGQPIAPRFVILLSNMHVFNPVSLQSADAINRRKNVHFSLEKADARRPTGANNQVFKHITRTSHRELSFVEAQDLVVECFSAYVAKWEVLVYRANVTKTDRHAAAVKDLWNRLGKIATEKAGDINVTAAYDARRHAATIIAVERKPFCNSPWLQSIINFYNTYASSFYTHILDLISITTSFALLFGLIHMLRKYYLSPSYPDDGGYADSEVLFDSVWYDELCAGKLDPKVTPYDPNYKRELSGTTNTARFHAPRPKEKASYEVVPMLNRNTVKIQIGDRATTALFVGGTTILANRHIFHNTDATDNLFVSDGTPILLVDPITKNTEKFSFGLSSLYYDTSVDTDICFYNFSSPSRLRRSILQHFWTGGSDLTNHDIDLPVFYNDHTYTLHSTTIKRDAMKQQLEADMQGRIQLRTLHDTFTARYTSKAGTCGSPAILTNTGLISGILVAGLNADSYFQIVTRQMVEEALSHFSTAVRSAQFGPMMGEHLAKEKAGIPHFIYASTSKPLYLPTRTTIRPSIFFDKIKEHTTIPSILSLRDPRLRQPDGSYFDVYRYGIRKYKTTPPFDPQQVKVVSDSLVEDMFMWKSTSTKRVLQWDEVINGIAGVHDSLDFSTSPGFPFALQGLSKKQCFRGEVGAYTLRPDIHQQLVEYEYTFSKGEIPDLPYLDFMKDERRITAKALAGKTRLISAASLYHTMLVRKYFLSFIEHFYRSHNQGYSSVGINRASQEWDIMVRHLLTVSDQGFDGDYTAYDGSLPIQLMSIVANMANAYYDDDYSLLRSTLVQSDSHSLHIFFDHVYELVGGNPSGSPLTVVFNTVVGEAYLRLSWLNIVPRPIASIFHYRKNVRTKIYGDDNVVSVSPELLSTFNAGSISSFLSQWGIEYGCASKDVSKFVLHKPILDCSFLKNGIATLNGRYVPVMEEDACLETLNWIRDAPQPEQAAVINANCVLRSYFFHGKAKFDKLRSQLFSLHPDSYLTYSELFSEFFSTGCLTPWGNDFGFSISDYNRDILRSVLTEPRPIEQSGSVSMPSNITTMSLPTTETSQTTTSPVTLPSTTSPTSTASASTSQLDSTQYAPIQGQGVTLVEQSTPDVAVLETGKTVMQSARAESHMNDVAWDLDKMLSRQNLVDTIQWGLTDAPGTQLRRYDIVTDLLQQDIVSVPFTRFEYWRCQRIRLYLQLTASRFYQGRLLACFLPSCRPKDSIFPTTNINNQILLQHVVLDPANGSNAILDITFTHPKGWLNLLDNDSLGQVEIYVFNQLQAVVGSPTFVEVKAFVQIEGSEFKIPRPGGSSLSMLKNLIKLSLGKDWDIVPREKAGPLDALTTPLNLVGDVLSLLDKPQIPVPPDLVVRKDMSYLSPVVGADYVEKLQAYPKEQQLCDNEHIGSDSIMSIAHYVKEKLNYVTTLSWKIDSPPGTILYSWPVGPYSLFEGHPGTQFAMDSIDYFARGYHHWRGGFCYVIDVVSSQFHEGRLDLTFHPNQSSAPTDYAAGMSQYAASIAVRNGVNCSSYTVPFLSDTPWKRCWSGQKLSDTTSDDAERFQDYFSGTLALRVSAALRATSTIVPAVDINIFRYAAPDFELSYPSYTNLSICPVASGPSRKTKAVPREKSGTPFLLNQCPALQDSFPLAPTNATTGDNGTPHFSEKYDNMQELAKRYTPLTSLPLPPSISEGQTAGVDPIVLVLQPAVDIWAPPSNYLYSAIADFTAHHRLFRGPLCFKVSVRGMPDARGYVTYAPSGPGVLQFPAVNAAVAHYFAPHKSRGNLPRAYFSPNQVAEFEIPFIANSATQMLANNRDMSIVKTQSNLFYNPGLLIYIYNSPHATYIAGVVDIHVSFADETQTGLFLGLPLCTIDIDKQYLDSWP
jgi:hypothetical protein